MSLTIIIIAVAVVMMLGPIAGPGTDQFGCSVDADCIKVDAGCCGCNAGGEAIAINKGYSETWNNKLLQDCHEIGCPDVISQHISCYSEPKCESSTCRLVPKTGLLCASDSDLLINCEMRPEDNWGNPIDGTTCREVFEICGFPQKANVRINMDKTSFGQGEEVKATLSYEGKIYAWDWHGWAIQRLYENEWVSVRRSGDLRCDHTPSCDSVNVEEIEYCPPIPAVACEAPAWQELEGASSTSWGQELIASERIFECILGDLVLPMTCYEFGQALPGKYKILFEYAMQIDPNDPMKREGLDIKYAEKEFEIFWEGQ